MMSSLGKAAAIPLLAGLIAAGPALSESDERPAPAAQENLTKENLTKEQIRTAAEAKEIVEKAASVVQKMTSDDRLAGLLKQSKGVFILPYLMKGGLVVGGRGGEGVLLSHKGGKWSNPAFFNLGAVTLGAQAGGAVGPLVMLLMSDEAVRRFRQQNNFALDASAGLSIVGYDVVGRADTGQGDVIVWSDQAGAFAGATIGASGISVDDDKNRAYYRANVSTGTILEGNVKNPHTKRLQEKFPG